MKLSTFLILFFALPPFVSRGEACVWNVSSANSHFVGREAVLRQIEQALGERDPRVALIGGPGFGKSQIAKQYAHLSLQRYDLIWWFEASNTLAHQFEKLASALNKFLNPLEQIDSKKVSLEKLVGDVKTILENKKILCLFIFDSTENLKEIAAYLPRGVPVLVTSRTRVTPFETIEVRPFSHTESQAFLGKALPKASQEEHIKLASSLSHHPLAVATAASFLAADQILSALYTQSLVDVEKNDNPEKVRISMHELIHKLIHDQMTEA